MLYQSAFPNLNPTVSKKMGPAEKSKYTNIRGTQKRGWNLLHSMVVYLWVHFILKDTLKKKQQPKLCFKIFLFQHNPVADVVAAGSKTH